MKIYHELPDGGAYADLRERRPLVAAIGFFDGFHRGHQAIVRALLRERTPGRRAGIITFRNHPTAYLRPDQAPPLVATLDERINALGAAGIDELFLLRFDDAIASLSPQAFLERTLEEQIRVRAVVVGENFRFGAKRAGDVAYAREHLCARGIGFVTVPNVVDGDDRVSSTRIRAAVVAGDLGLADRLLGHSYMLRGRVELGEGRGHDLGFPTANLTLAGEKLLPPDGVYATVARLDGRDYPGLVSVGTNPTFDGGRRTIEVWLRDFRDSIYGADLVLRDFRFLREQVRFDGVDALREQMHADAAAVPYPTLRSS